MHQDVQAKVQEEFDRVISSDRMITVGDKQNLPYCNAVILESQRMTNLLSVNLLRYTTRDVDINGYHIKKNSTVIPQISVIMIDPKVRFFVFFAL